MEFGPKRSTLKYDIVSFLDKTFAYLSIVIKKTMILFVIYCLRQPIRRMKNNGQ